jgi:hypothetical protein
MPQVRVIAAAIAVPLFAQAAEFFYENCLHRI